MNESKDSVRKLNMLYLQDKMQHIMNNCYQKCTVKSKPGSSLSGRESGCIENCQIKQVNAYNFIFKVVEEKGISRSAQSQLKRMAL